MIEEAGMLTDEVPAWCLDQAPQRMFAMFE
jgi:hypothetical protein